MRTAFLAALVAAACGLLDSGSAFAQKRDRIYGQTCNQLFRSCFRICARHKGEPDWANCDADCNAGQKTCRATGVWKSRNATIMPARR
ncbi:MAG TPA: hypothetical protein VHA55_08870 [Pseudorhodoplanes sp.]|jgi:hypothetical protein|nr:hypothetical protein [Pseudorhodoplanes sp.]